MGCFMICSICYQNKHDDDYEYFGGKDAYHDDERVCDQCVDRGIELLKDRMIQEAENNG